MEHNRRTFLKTAGLAGVAAMTTTAVAPAAAQAAMPKSEPKEMPKGMTFATLRQGDTYSLG
jgi:Spy/CpxP family protein refolding chaperone